MQSSEDWVNTASITEIRRIVVVLLLLFFVFVFSVGPIVREMCFRFKEKKASSFCSAHLRDK